MVTPLTIPHALPLATCVTVGNRRAQPVIETSDRPLGVGLVSISVKAITRHKFNKIICFARCNESTREKYSDVYQKMLFYRGKSDIDKGIIPRKFSLEITYEYLLTATLQSV